MIQIPKNTRRATAAGAKPDAAKRDRLVKRVLDAFAKGQPSCFLGGGGANGITENEGRQIGRLFVDKDYFASLLYSVDGRFRGLSVSTAQIGSFASPVESAGTACLSKLGPATQGEPAPEPECDVWTHLPEAEDPGGEISPDMFSFNGEAVVLVSDPGKPYAIYRRAYPHKPKWIVADSSHRILCLLPWRSHAQIVCDELNTLAAKK